jgi:hypothetical protein
LKDVFASFFMEFVIWGEDEEVVHIDDKPSFSNHILEGVVHEVLEGHGSW